MKTILPLYQNFNYYRVNYSTLVSCRIWFAASSGGAIMLLPHLSPCSGPPGGKSVRREGLQVFVVVGRGQLLVAMPGNGGSSRHLTDTTW
jgi:hypothetical protein